MNLPPERVLELLESERQLAVARQTIRSLQNALAAEHRDDEALIAREQELKALAPLAVPDGLAAAPAVEEQRNG